MVMFIFGDRDIQCSYFPNDRVLYDIRNKDLTVDAALSSEDTLGLQAALHRASVNFNRSDIGDNSCNTYYLEFEEKAKTFVIENCDSTVSLKNVEAL